MPYYRDGTPAKLRDVVKGKGYNVKDAAGQLVELVGVVMFINPGATTCNLKVARVKLADIPTDFRFPNYELFDRKALIEKPNDGPGLAATLEMEYGQCDHFDLLYRAPEVAAAAENSAAEAPAAAPALA